MPPEVAPYGSWRSPVTSRRVTSRSVRLGSPVAAGEDVYWTEGRPQEKGRNALVRRRADGVLEDLTPPPYNVRTRACEYGGGDFFVAPGRIFFSNFTDQRLYLLEPGGEPRELTAAGPRTYADGVWDAGRGRIVCVREDSPEGAAEPSAAVVAIDPGSGEQTPLAEGADFYSNPRLSPDGERLAWIEWRHPNMPWDGTELVVARLDAAGAVVERTTVAGGPEESIVQPEWSPAGNLVFLGDRTGWWNFYRWTPGGEARLVLERAAEFGYPRWVFGMSSYAFESSEAIVCSYASSEGRQLARLALETGALEDLPCPWAYAFDLTASARGVVFKGGSPTEPSALVERDRETGEYTVLRRSAEPDEDLEAYLSTPRAIEFPTTGGLTAHAWFYPPRNPDFAGPKDERPPLIVISHGGPTAQADPTLDLKKAFWTSRGYAIVDVNYGGSTGYGRAYRERLTGTWGVVDVDDCANAALYLAEQGEVDREQLIIRGGSAGGYTTLSALAFRDVFRAGSSYYGVGDLEALAKDTHKFESRYLDKLVAPYPEGRDLYLERSPIHHIDGFDAPVIFLQGAEDRVVPPEQSEAMVRALRKKGYPVGYVLFAGEQHGFRSADAIERALDAELDFFSSVVLKTGLRF